MIKNFYVRVLAKLLLVLLPILVVHSYYFKYQGINAKENKLLLAYFINFLLAVFIVSVLYRLRDKYRSQIGFLFMFGSLLKFAVFFVVFYPGYKQDGSISKIEFTTFFIPYALCLFVETVTLVRLLNREG